MMREPAWVRKSLEAQIKRDSEPKPDGFIYIMSRSDGWHKIGLTVGRYVNEYRRLGVSCHLPEEKRPVRLVVSRPVFSSVYMAEKIAHYELERLGYERDVGYGRTEWFNVSEAVARRVVKWAIRRVDSEDLADLRRERQRLYAAKRRARNT